MISNNFNLEHFSISHHRTGIYVRIRRSLIIAARERVSRINTDASARARRSILSYRIPTRIYTSNTSPSIPEYLHSRRLPRTHYTRAHAGDDIGNSRQSGNIRNARNARSCGLADHNFIDFPFDGRIFSCRVYLLVKRLPHSLARVFDSSPPLPPLPAPPPPPRIRMNNVFLSALDGINYAASAHTSILSAAVLSIISSR